MILNLTSLFSTLIVGVLFYAHAIPTLTAQPVQVSTYEVPPASDLGLERYSISHIFYNSPDSIKLVGRGSNPGSVEAKDGVIHENQRIPAFVELIMTEDMAVKESFVNYVPSNSFQQPMSYRVQVGGAEKVIQRHEIVSAPETSSALEEIAKIRIAERAKLPDTEPEYVKSFYEFTVGSLFAVSKIDKIIVNTRELRGDVYEKNKDKVFEKDYGAEVLPDGAQFSFFCDDAEDPVRGRVIAYRGIKYKKGKELKQNHFYEQVIMTFDANGEMINSEMIKDEMAFGNSKSYRFTEPGPNNIMPMRKTVIVSAQPIRSWNADTDKQIHRMLFISPDGKVEHKRYIKLDAFLAELGGKGLAGVRNLENGQYMMTTFNADTKEGASITYYILNNEGEEINRFKLTKDHPFVKNIAYHTPLNIKYYSSTEELEQKTPGGGTYIFDEIKQTDPNTQVRTYKGIMATHINAAGEIIDIHAPTAKVYNTQALIIPLVNDEQLSVTLVLNRNSGGKAYPQVFILDHTTGKISSETFGNAQLIGPEAFDISVEGRRIFLQMLDKDGQQELKVFSW